jgi:hypothetical protein
MVGKEHINGERKALMAAVGYNLDSLCYQNELPRFTVMVRMPPLTDSETL